MRLVYKACSQQLDLAVGFPGSPGIVFVGYNWLSETCPLYHRLVVVCLLLAKMVYLHLCKDFQLGWVVRNELLATDTGWECHKLPNLHPGGSAEALCAGVGQECFLDRSKEASHLDEADIGDIQKPVEEYCDHHVVGTPSEEDLLVSHLIACRGPLNNQAVKEGCNMDLVGDIQGIENSLMLWHNEVHMIHLHKAP